VSTAGLGAHGLVPTFGFPADTTVAVLRLVLGGIYERHPQLKLVVSHSLSLLPGLLGRVDHQAVHEPGAQGRLNGPPSEHLRMLYTDTVCASAPLLRFVIDFLGPERVLFGSDYPFWDRATALATLDAAIGDHAEMDSLGWRNASRIFGLTEPAASPTAH
jgi:aminocarboxymuconate-semialdehyde decarboxylase